MFNFGSFFKNKKMANNINDQVPNEENIEDCISDRSIELDDGFLNYKDGPDQKWISDDGYTVDIRTRKRINLNPVESCGFDFSDVVVQANQNVDKETGEILHDDVVVILDGENLNKAYSSFAFAVESSKGLSETIPEYNYQIAHKVSRFISVQLDHANEEKASNPWMITSTAVIAGLTPTGKVKKYPIRSTVLFSSNSFDCTYRVSLHVVSCYLKDGSIGKACLVMWLDHIGVKCDFVKSKEGLLEIKKYEIL